MLAVNNEEQRWWEGGKESNCLEKPERCKDKKTD